MVKYTKRFVKGKLFYIARLNGAEIAIISECNTFVNKWNVQRTDSDNVHEFTSIEAAQNFIDNTAQMRKVK